MKRVLYWAILFVLFYVALLGFYMAAQLAGVMK